MPSLNIDRNRKPPIIAIPICCSTAVPYPSSISIWSKIVHFDLKTYRISLMVQLNPKIDEAIPVQFPQ